MAKQLLLLSISFIWEKEEMTTASHKPGTSMDTLSLNHLTFHSCCNGHSMVTTSCSKTKKFNSGYC